MEANNELLRKFGSRVQHYRTVLGLSQEKLADKAGFHRTYIGTVERGETNVTLLNIYKLAEALEITVEDFFNNKPIK